MSSIFRYSCTCISFIITILIFANLHYYQSWSQHSTQFMSYDVNNDTTKKDNINTNPDIIKKNIINNNNNNNNNTNNESNTLNQTKITHPDLKNAAQSTYELSKYIYTDKSQYILNPSDTCAQNPDLEVIICVPISRSNSDKRRTISETWGTYAYDEKNKAALFFFVGNGSASESPEIQAQILNESKHFDDIIQEDYIDSYRNLSLKSISILKWVTTYCPQAKFVIKADDDMYVTVPNLVKLLHETKTKFSNGKFILGYSISGGTPLRHKKSKWHTTVSEFPGTAYPNYVSGTCYAMAMEAAHRLLEASQTTAPFWLEDIYITGILRTEAGVAVVGTYQMTYNKPKPSGCVFRHRISGHRYTQEQIRHIHKELTDTHLVC